MLHVILDEVIAVDLEDNEAIMDGPTPTNVTYVRSFMGIAGYYISFIDWFSKIDHPITSMQ